MAYRQVWPIYVLFSFFFFFLFEISWCSLYSGALNSPNITVLLTYVFPPA